MLEVDHVHRERVEGFDRIEGGHGFGTSRPGSLWRRFRSAGYRLREAWRWAARRQGGRRTCPSSRGLLFRRIRGCFKRREYGLDRHLFLRSGRRRVPAAVDAPGDRPTHIGIRLQVAKTVVIHHA